MGRPPKTETKDKKITVRLSDEEYDDVQCYAAKQNLTITQVVVKALEKFFHDS